MELDRRDAGDRQRSCDLFDQWQRVKKPLLKTLFAPFPPVRGPLGLLRRLGTADALRLAHLLMLPVGVMAQHLFDGKPPVSSCWATRCTPTSQSTRRAAV